MEYAVGKELLPRHFRFQAAFGTGEDFRMMRLVRSFCIKEKGSLKPNPSSKKPRGRTPSGFVFQAALNNFTRRPNVPRPYSPTRLA